MSSDAVIRALVEAHAALAERVRHLETAEQSGGITVVGRLTVSSTLVLSRSDLTIAGGVVTVTRSYHRLDTEGGAATDDLDTINGGTTGQLLILGTASGTHDVTLKDGTGNLLLAGDFVLDTTADAIVLLAVGASWVELARSNNL